MNQKDAIIKWVLILHWKVQRQSFLKAGKFIFVLTINIYFGNMQWQLVLKIKIVQSFGSNAMDRRLFIGTL